MAKILLTNPAYDSTTKVLSSWISQTATYVDGLGSTSIHIKGHTVNTKNLNRVIDKHKPTLVTFSGHGENDLLYGYNHRVLYHSKDDHTSLRDTIVHAIACSSGNNLGDAMIKNGVKGFVGFKDEFRLHYIDGSTADPVASLFLEPAYHVTRALAEGKTLSESFTESQKMFAKSYRTAAVAKNADRNILSSLYHNMKHHMWLGEADARA